MAALRARRASANGSSARHDYRFRPTSPNVAYNFGSGTIHVTRDSPFALRAFCECSSEAHRDLPHPLLRVQRPRTTLLEHGRTHKSSIGPCISANGGRDRSLADLCQCRWRWRADQTSDRSVAGFFLCTGRTMTCKICINSLDVPCRATLKRFLVGQAQTCA